MRLLSSCFLPVLNCAVHFGFRDFGHFEHGWRNNASRGLLAMTILELYAVDGIVDRVDDIAWFIDMRNSASRTI